MNIRTTIAGALVAGALASAAAPALAAPVEFQFWHAMGGALGDEVNKIAQDFNQSQDKYKVDPVYKGNYTDTMTAAIAAFRAHQQPALLQVFEVGTATMMAAKGAIKPVYQVMQQANVKWNPDGFLPAVKSYYADQNGHLLSFPFNSSTPVMWYNKDRLDSVGAQPPKTWNDVFQIADKLKGTDHPCAFTIAWQPWTMIENFQAWHDLPIGTLQNGYGGLGTKLVFNQDHKLAALLQKIADLQKTGGFKYGGRRGDPDTLFTSGECAMMLESSASRATIQKTANFKFGETMMPVDTAIAQKPQNSIIGGATLWVLQGKDPATYDAVAHFLAYLGSPKVQAQWAEFTGYVPVTTAAYDLMKKQGYYAKNPGAEIPVEELSLNHPTANSRGLRFGNYVQIRDIIDEELEQLWSGKLTAQQALDAAAERGNKLLRQFEQQNS